MSKQIDALKLALEALKENQHLVADNERHAYVMEYNSIIEKCDEALAQKEQEPVAWIHNFIDGGISIGKRPADLNRHPDRWTALYKEPKPCPTCEALARTVMLDQTSHDTTPPQRTWVGLTYEDIERIKLLTFEKEINTNGEEQEAVNLDQLIRAAEQLCKEKNYE